MTEKTTAINPKKQFNWELVKSTPESRIALDTMQDMLWSMFYEEEINQIKLLVTDAHDPTRLYAGAIIVNIFELFQKKDKTVAERKVMLDYLRELEGIIWIKSKVWHRFTPVENVSFEDDLSG